MPVKKTATDIPEVKYQYPTVDEKAIIKKASDLSTEITAIIVKDQETYTLAGQARGRVQAYIKWLDTFYGPIKAVMNAAVEKIREEEKRVIGPRLTFAENLLDGLNRKMSDFLIAEDRRVKEEARIKQEEENRKAEIERNKLNKKAEKAEAKGKESVAEQFREQAATVAAPTVQVKQTVSFAGTGTMAKDDIAVEIIDPRLFIKYLLDSGAPITEMIEFKYAKVKKYVKGLEIMPGEQVQKAPGIKVNKKKVISAR